MLNEIEADLLKKHGYTTKDVDELFREKTKQLEEKKIVYEIVPVEGKKQRRIGRFVTLRQSDYPLKMFVLQELDIDREEPEVRLGYYIVSKRILRDKGKLALMWGQFNPNIPKKDLKELIKKAENKGIL